MLDLLLAAHDGGTSWRQLFKPGEARAGFECVGPAGLARSVVVDKHGGDISVETELGKGTCFVLRLPISGAAA